MDNGLKIVKPLKLNIMSKIKLIEESNNEISFKKNIKPNLVNISRYIEEVENDSLAVCQMCKPHSIEKKPNTTWHDSGGNSGRDWQVPNSNASADTVYDDGAKGV